MTTSRREFAMSGAALLALAARGTGLAGADAAAAAAPAAFDVTPYVHPELRAMLGMFQRGGAASSISAETLAAARKADFSQPPLATPAWTERMIPGRGGAPEVRILVVNAGARGAPRPAILHTHGGGYILGSAKSELRRVQEVAQALDCVIVSVDYRLAPETRFAGSLEDNYAGLLWLYRNAAELGVDRGRIAVMGGSAGGGHAAILAIAARDRGEVPLIYQALIYPMLDDRTGSVRIKPPFAGAVVWTPASNRFAWTSFLGVPAGSRSVPAGAVPARLENLRGLPPAFIGVGTLDLFLDEDVDYAQRLLAAGVAVELNVVPGGFHGFDMVAEAGVAKRFNAAVLEALRSAFTLKW